ncbi:MAG: PKD domain-containing protein, partial [Phycisphaerae bacterium]
MMSHAPHAPWSGLETLEPRLLLSAADSVFGITAASPLGGTGDDAVRGAVLQDDGTIVLAANISDATPGGLTPTLLNGATASSPGALVRLSADGQTVLGVTRLAEKVLDLSEDDSGNLYVAMHDQGFAKLSPDASSILYSRTTADLGFANVQRIDTGPLGYTAVLGGGGLDSGSNLGPNVRVYDPAGTLLGSDNSGRWKNDVAIDEASQTVVYLGYRNAYDSASGLPVQVSYYRGIAYDGTVKYTGYDWSTSETDPNYLNGPENNMADTRGYRAEIGEDGYLYLAFESAGGNNIFNHDPFDINTDVSLAGGDRWHVPYATGANHITYFGRYQPGNGQYVLGNHYLTRLSDNDGNTLRIQKGSITADADGRVYLGGSSAWGLPLEGHPLGDSNVSFNPGVNNNYLGGAFLTVMSPGMDSRLYTTRLAGDWVHAVAVEPRADGDDAIVFGGGTSGEVWLHDGVQMTAGGADDGWFGVIADSDPDPTNSAPLADFQAASAGGTTDTILLSLDATGSDDPDGDPLQYLWVFGDGERAEGVTVTHEISSTANRTVTLTVLDGRGGWATSSTTFGPPDAAFQMSGFRGEAPLAVEFDASATTGAENPHLLSYQWDFGDGTLGGGISARHEYAEPGAYEVTLTVTDALGATSIATDLITVTDPAAWTMRLDFEGADGDTADGFLHAPIEAYTPEVGYGYETVDPEYQVVNQGNFADEMLTDGHDAGTSYH